MGSRKKKKSRGWFVSMFFLSKIKSENNNKASSSSSKSSRRRRSLDLKHYELKDMSKPCFQELEDMRKLSSNDEAFHLSSMKIYEIIEIILSRKTPTPKTYMKWNAYAISFYLKMCTCFGVDYQHLEATSEVDCPNEPPTSASPSITKEMSLNEQEEHAECSGVNQPSTKEMSYEERLYQLERLEVVSCLVIYRDPHEFGSYSPGTSPVRIPYHLYLLVKKAVDIMNHSEWRSNINDLRDLKTVEKKIRFFCTYFYSHLPTGWEYDRDTASADVANYDLTRTPIYNMAGYTPIRDLYEPMACDEKTNLSRKGMMEIMSVINSRKTPSFWKMCWLEISFYCKLCSCFGIDYHRLEDASEDDVCLMNMGGNC